MHHGRMKCGRDKSTRRVTRIPFRIPGKASCFGIDRIDTSSRERSSLGRMISHGLIAIGDIITYRRAFPQLGNLVVEKDIIVSASIDPSWCT